MLVHQNTAHTGYSPQCDGLHRVFKLINILLRLVLKMIACNDMYSNLTLFASGVLT